MKLIWTIARQELRSHFDSLMAYILLVLFLGFSGFFTWIFGRDVFMEGQASLASFFSTAYWTLFFLIPAVTMKSVAEELRTGTIEMLLTKPVTHRQIIIGKYLAVMLLIGIALLLTLPYYISVANLGQVDHGSIICGYFGLLFMSSAYVGIGLFSSSITNNQIVSFLISLLIGIFFHFIFGLLAGQFNGILGQVTYYLSLENHFDSITRGVIDTKDLIYFASLTYAGIFLAEKSLQSKTS